jgi:sulfoxide reductase heme-binding subunit YedZ
VNLLQHHSLNGWPLFYLVATLTFATIGVGLVITGISSPETTVSMIRLSVQLASPWIFLAFLARPLVELYPGSFSKWLLRNRRYLGLSFAVGFAWQAVFIAVLLALYPDYYWQVLHNTADLVLRMLSYLLLLALTVTSFYPVRRAMRPNSWRALHLVGIWYFWAAIWVSYVGVLLIGDTRIIAIVYVIAGLIVVTFRVAAYLKKRSMPEMKLS